MLTEQSPRAHALSIPRRRPLATREQNNQRLGVYDSAAQRLENGSCSEDTARVFQDSHVLLVQDEAAMAEICFSLGKLHQRPGSTAIDFQGPDPERNMDEHDGPAVQMAK